MKYRKLGRTNLDISEISIGTEWLAKKNPEEITLVLNKAIEYGVNYFDIIFNMPDYLKKISKAIEGIRDKLILSHHFGSHYQNNKYMKTRSIKICQKDFEEYLKIMKTDYVDLLFITFVMNEKQYEECLKPNGVLDQALKLKEEGKARFIAMSTHSAKVAIRAAINGKIDVIMIQLNLASNGMPYRKEMLATCSENNIGLIAMKPFAGGNLLKANKIVSIGGYKVGAYDLKKEKDFSKKKIAEDATAIKCLHYALSQMGVSAAVPGVSNIEELDDCMAYYSASEVELDYSNLIKEFDEYIIGVCVYCNHCQPCPEDIDIGSIFRLYDLAKIVKTEGIIKEYNNMKAKASNCTKCGVCIKRCPFEVKIIDQMKEVAKFFE
ncbi:MAG: aldo/keto reductase [Candidatus Heimdallarchaeota archaeon]|nr:aldo/keto reductase [Candidatus Heimdallarchaeota archaeon]